MVAPCHCQSASALEFSTIPETLTVGDQISVTGGRPGYTFSFSGGTIDEDSGEILTMDTCSGTFSVHDKCKNKISEKIQFTGGQWVIQTDTGSPDSNYIKQVVTDNNTRTTTYYQYCGCTVSEQQYLVYGNTACVDNNMTSTAPVTAIQWSNSDICGEAPLKPAANLEGSVSLVSSANNPFHCTSSGGNVYVKYGWKSYCKDTEHKKVEFRCD